MLNTLTYSFVCIHDYTHVSTWFQFISLIFEVFSCLIAYYLIACNISNCLKIHNIETLRFKTRQGFCCPDSLRPVVVREGRSRSVSPLTHSFLGYRVVSSRSSRAHRREPIIRLDTQMTRLLQKRLHSFYNNSMTHSFVSSD